MHIHDIDRDHTFENLFQSAGTPMQPTSKKQIRGSPEAKESVPTKMEEKG